MKKIDEIKKFLEVEELNKLEQGVVIGGVNTKSRRWVKQEGDPDIIIKE